MPRPQHPVQPDTAGTAQDFPPSTSSALDMCHMCIPHCHCHCPAPRNTLKLKYFNTIPSHNHLSLPVLVLCTIEKEVPLFTKCRTAHV